MRHKILLLAFSAVLFTSCSTYKAGQTPDDVYYSPARELVAKEEREVKRDRYDEYISSADDRYLRMKIQNRERWSDLDDYAYWNDSRYHDCNSAYSYNNNFAFNNPYNNLHAFNTPYNNLKSYSYNLNNSVYGYRSNTCVQNNFRMNNYFGYGGYYSPRYPIVYYKSPKLYTGTTGKANLSTYRNPNYNNTNYSSKASNQNNFGNLMKRVFSDQPGNSNSNSSWDRPVRTIEPGTSTNNAGGRSGGYNSTGTSTPAKREPRNQ